MSSSPKVVVVTGASQGIGAETVKAFRKLGHKVVATARGVKPTDDPGIATVAGDIADPATARLVIDTAVSRFGRVDTLINNAGVFIAKPFTRYTAEDYATMVAINLTGFFHMTQSAVAEMEKHAAGHVVNITTTLVDRAVSSVPSVLASLTKGGVAAATRSLAIEYAKRGIRVNAVSPGIIKSPMHPPATHDALGAMHPIGHMGEMSDIVNAILYLDTAPFVTGETLHVDGGQIAGH
ncbi:3-oxoacyl-ACP reductase [Burkholderia cepacia]|nr:3-oxoacyl-ACP reductase [Burkholderia cepacia]